MCIINIPEEQNFNSFDDKIYYYKCNENTMKPWDTVATVKFR